MSVKAYRPSPDDDHLAVNTDINDDWPQRMAREQLIPMIAKKTRNALNTVPVYMEHFQRLRVGRRCSCWFAEDDPQNLCKLCFGTGIVGGFQKRGCKVDVLDVTTPYTVCVNVVPDYNSLTRPVHYTLVKSAVRGSIEFVWEPVKNIGSIDSLDLFGATASGCHVEYSIKVANDTGFVPLTEANLVQRLVLAVPITLRVDMWRDTPKAPIPRFVGMRCSYRTRLLSGLRCDIPRPQESKTLEESGIYNSTGMQQLVFGNDLKAVSNDDFFVNLTDKSRWKVTEIQPNRVLGINTSWDLMCRVMQDHDRYSKIPLGRLDMSETRMPPDAVRSMQTEQTVYDSKGNTHTRLPGNRADIDQAHSLAVGVRPGALVASKPTAER